jgi:hypothetical protein
MKQKSNLYKVPEPSYPDYEEYIARPPGQYQDFIV